MIPIFAEFSYQRFLQKLIQRYAFLFAETLRGHAHAPLVIHYIREAVFFHQSDRVKMTADRFPEVDFAFFVSLFDGAESCSVFVKINKSALLAVDELGSQSTEVVVVVNVVFFNSFDAFGTHVRLNLLDIFLNNAHFIRLERRSGVTSHAALTFASRELAAETGVEELVGYYNIVDNNHGAKIIKSHADLAENFPRDLRAK